MPETELTSWFSVVFDALTEVEEYDITEEHLADMIWLTAVFAAKSEAPDDQRKEQVVDGKELAGEFPTGGDDNTDPGKDKDESLDFDDAGADSGRDIDTNTPSNEPKFEEKPEVSENELFMDEPEISGEIHAVQRARIARARSLPRSREISRALWPIRRRYPSRFLNELDEDATARFSAETHLTIPVFVPRRTRWLSLTIVIDNSSSMKFWNRTLREFQKMMQLQGAFDEIQVVGLDTSQRDDVYLTSRDGKTKRNIKELFDPLGKRIVLFASDCVAPAWYSLKLIALIDELSQSQPVAILQMLPPWMWHQTSLGNGEMAFARAVYKGSPNSKLRSDAISPLAEKSEFSAVPIITFDPERMASWADVLAGQGNSVVGGYFLDAGVVPEPILALPQVRVDRFLRNASNEAVRLAVLLSAYPIHKLETIRIIHEAMIPNGLQTELAELFLGGLLKRIETAPDGQSLIRKDNSKYVDPEDQFYQFYDGVPALLKVGLSRADGLIVLQKVSEHISKVHPHLRDCFTLPAKVYGDEARGALSSESLKYKLATLTADALTFIGIGPASHNADAAIPTAINESIVAKGFETHYSEEFNDLWTKVQRLKGDAYVPEPNQHAVIIWPEGEPRDALELILRAAGFAITFCGNYLEVNWVQLFEILGSTSGTIFIAAWPFDESEDDFDRNTVDNLGTLLRSRDPVQSTNGVSEEQDFLVAFIRDFGNLRRQIENSEEIGCVGIFDEHTSQDQACLEALRCFGEANQTITIESISAQSNSSDSLEMSILFSRRDRTRDTGTRFKSFGDLGTHLVPTQRLGFLHGRISGHDLSGIEVTWVASNLTRSYERAYLEGCNADVLRLPDTDLVHALRAPSKSIVVVESSKPSKAVVNSIDHNHKKGVILYANA